MIKKVVMACVVVALVTVLAGVAGCIQINVPSNPSMAPTGQSTATPTQTSALPSTSTSTPTPAVATPIARNADSRSGDTYSRNADSRSGDTYSRNADAHTDLHTDADTKRANDTNLGRSSGDSQSDKRNVHIFQCDVL